MSGECLERICGQWQLAGEWEPEAVVGFVENTGLWFWWARGEMGDASTREAAAAAADDWLARLDRYDAAKAARAEGASDE